MRRQLLPLTDDANRCKLHTGFYKKESLKRKFSSYIVMKASLMPCLLFNFLHHLLKVFLPGGFENLLAILFPLLEIAKADAQLVRILSLR